MTSQEFIKSVPKHVTIMGDVYGIKVVERVELDDERDFAFGMADFTNREILIATHDSKGKPLPVSVMETTLYHEISHIILDAGQYLELSSQEFLVEWLGRSMKDVVKAFGKPAKESKKAAKTSKKAPKKVKVEG